MAKIIEIIKKNKDDIIKPIVVLLAICIVIPLALSLTNKVTVNRIAELERKNSEATMSKLIKAEKFKTADFKEGEDVITYNIAFSGDKEIGYVFTTASKGYGGAVSVMTAVNIDGTVKQVAILDVSGETPGLGQNAGKEKFYKQFKGKKNGITLKKGGAVSENNEIDAVTGATITSKAVNNAVNEALSYYEKITAKSKGGDGQ